MHRFLRNRADKQTNAGVNSAPQLPSALVINKDDIFKHHSDFSSSPQKREAIMSTYNAETPQGTRPGSS